MLEGLIEVVDWLVHNSAFTVLHIQGVQKKITQSLMHCNIAVVNCRVVWFSPKYSEIRSQRVKKDSLDY